MCINVDTEQLLPVLIRSLYISSIMALQEELAPHAAVYIQPLIAMAPLLSAMSTLDVTASLTG